MKKTRLLEIIREEIVAALNEAPFIGGQYDISYDPKTKEIEKDILKKAIEDAVKVIKKEGENVASTIVNKKARKDPRFQAVLAKVDQAIQKQSDTFEDPKTLKDLSNQPKSPDVSKYLSGEKTFSDKLQKPQTEKAVANITSDKPAKEEKPKAEKPKKEKPEPKSKSKEKDEEGDEEFEKLEKAEKEFYSSEEEPEQTEKAPVGDKGTEQKARKQDKIIKAYKSIESELKDKIQQAKTGDKTAMNWLKEKQPIIKAYNALKKVEV